MAERKDILKDIRSHAGNALNKSEVGRYLGLGRNSTNAFLKDVPFYSLDNKTKIYLAIDLAKEIDRCGSK